MKIEIRVTYAATDGRMPEDVSVDMEFDAPSVGPMAMEQAVLPVLDRLLHAPGAVDAVRFKMAAQPGTEPASVQAAPAATDSYSSASMYQECGSALCGHYRHHHLDAGNKRYAGPCSRCGECRFFMEGEKEA